jgi:hypothetical protein
LFPHTVDDIDIRVIYCYRHKAKLNNTTLLYVTAVNFIYALLGISNAVPFTTAIKYSTNEQKEDVMRALATLMGTLAPVTAFAAAGASEEGSGIFVWIFLGFFAMIVVGQLVPAVMLMTGLVKGITAKTEAKSKAK